MKKIAKVIGAVVLAIAILAAALLLWLSELPSVPTDYTTQVRSLWRL